MKKRLHYRARVCLYFVVLIFESRAIKQDRHHPHQQSHASSLSKHERTSWKAAEEITQAK